MPFEFVAMTALQLVLVTLACVALSWVSGRWAYGDRRPSDWVVILGAGIILTGSIRWFLALARDLFG